jgi:hypothetical protein
MAAPVFTPTDTMVTRVAGILNSLNIYPADPVAEPLLWINQATQHLQGIFDILRNDFTIACAASTDQQTDTAAPYPYKIRNAWFNGKPISWCLRSTIDADIAAGETVVYRYSVVRESGGTHTIRLSAPALITDTLLVSGPYMPVYTVSGGNLNMEQKYDEAVECIAVQRGIYNYTEDKDKRAWADKMVEEVLKHDWIAEG